jgi:hypothetical protein
MIWYGTALALVAWAGGIWMGVVWSDYTLTTTRVTHRREMDQIFEEVNRLRAQVAELIGKE